MNLDELQKQKVAQWIADGLKLSEIQNRIEQDFGLRVTYMKSASWWTTLSSRPKIPNRPNQSPPFSPPRPSGRRPGRRPPPDWVA